VLTTGSKAPDVTTAPTNNEKLLDPSASSLPGGGRQREKRLIRAGGGQDGDAERHGDIVDKPRMALLADRGWQHEGGDRDRYNGDLVKIESPIDRKKKELLKRLRGGGHAGSRPSYLRL